MEERRKRISPSESSKEENKNENESNGHVSRQETGSPEDLDRCKSKQSADSGSVSSDTLTRKGLRQHLAETTDQLMNEVLATLKSERASGAAAPETDATEASFNAPVFDKSIDYALKVQMHSNVLQQLDRLLEDHSEDHNSLLKKYLGQSKRL